MIETEIVNLALENLHAYNSVKAFAMKFNGSSWAIVGSPAFSSGGAYFKC